MDRKWLLPMSCALCAALLAGCKNAAKEPESLAESTNPLDGVPPASVAQRTENTVTVLTAEQAHAMMEQGGVTVVDVRTAEEFAEGHIPGAVNLPNETIQEGDTAQLSDQSAVLLIYCRSGRRSAQAAEKLAILGYEQVYDFGGILDWPYEVTTE